VMIASWLILAIGSKRSVGRHWGKEIGVRLAILAVVLLGIRLTAMRHFSPNKQVFVPHKMPMELGGVVLCGLGIGLALWARITLGRNWGMPMSRKQDPELVTRGPYALARHPIYGGVLLAMLGSAIGANLFWIVPFLLFGAYFIFSARREEKIMIEEFPNQYRAYQVRTKMLLPFLI